MINNQTKEYFLKEYELCQQSVERLDSNIWKTSGFMGIGVIGTLVLLFSKIQILDNILLGWLIIALVVIWWSMSKRWWDIQHIIFLRMSHIEEILGFRQIKYIRYKDRVLEPGSRQILLREVTIEQLRELNCGMSKEEQEELIKAGINEEDLNHYREDPTKELLKEYEKMLNKKKHKKYLRRAFTFAPRGVQKYLKYFPVGILVIWSCYSILRMLHAINLPSRFWEWFFSLELL